jgi:DNA-binding GntR family transcriptional regulator
VRSTTVKAKVNNSKSRAAPAANVGVGQPTRDLAARIERDIHHGRFGRGAWLKQVDLEYAYGCSRLHVRQALDRLVDRGLVELIPNRGYRVDAFDARRLENILSIRAVLEVAACEAIVGNLDGDALDALTATAQQFLDTLSNGTIAEQEDANHAFHSALLAPCPNRDLVEMIFELRNRVPVSVRRENNTAAMLEQSAQDHFDIIDCLRRHDQRSLSAVMRRHVFGAIAKKDPGHASDGEKADRPAARKRQRQR